MHKNTVRLKDIRSSTIIEADLDRRLSFYENFILLEELTDIGLKNAQVYDPYKKIFLDRNIAGSEFDFKGLVFRHLLS